MQEKVNEYQERLQQFQMKVGETQLILVELISFKRFKSWKYLRC